VEILVEVENISVQASIFAEAKNCGGEIRAKPFTE
jgi:hypothetical protein